MAIGAFTFPLMQDCSHIPTLLTAPQTNPASAGWAPPRNCFSTQPDHLGRTLLWGERGIRDSHCSSVP